MSYVSRILFAALLCSTLGPVAVAQNDSSDEKLKRPPVQHGLILELSSRLTALNNSAANFSGLRLNWAMRVGQRHQTFVGFSGDVLTTPVHLGSITRTECHSTTCQVERDDLYLVSGYGGLNLRYSYRLNALFEIGVGATIGPGYAAINGAFDAYEYDPTYTEPMRSEDAFVVVEPGLEIAYRPTRFFGITLNGSYRYAPGFELPRSNRISGYNVGLGFQLGWL